MEGVHITHSRRKSIELSIDDNLQIAVKAPLWVTDRAIDHFIAQKADWISRQKAAKRLLTGTSALTGSGSGSAAPPGQGGTAASGGLLQPNSGRNPHRDQDNKCKKALWLLQREKQHLLFPLPDAVPQAAIDYVVVHELCHIRHHDHSPAFYRLVESVLPDYKERERLLRR